MILTCPQCATRYQADAAKFQPAGRNVRCAKCGHQWHQDAPPPEGDAEEPIEFAASEPSPPPEPVSAPVAPIPKPAAFAPNPLIAREPVVAPPRRMPPPAEPDGPSPWPRRLAVGAGWVALVALVLAVGWSALHFRQQVATVWPQSASVYAAMGMKTNASGLDIRDVVPKRAEENGEAVLTVTGRIVNSSTHELPVPQIRVALLDDENREIYHWLCVPTVMTLPAGKATDFTARLTNPPKAQHFEVRFVRTGE